MKTKMKCLLFSILLYLPCNSYCQLNSFLIGLYFYDNKVNQDSIDWLKSDSSYIEYLDTLKSYGFNTVKLSTAKDANENFFKFCNEVGLRSMLDISDIVFWEPTFNFENVIENNPRFFNGNNIGYDIKDEPNPLRGDDYIENEIRAYNRIVEMSLNLEQKNPFLIRHANLLPSWIFRTQGFNDYHFREQYLQKFINDSHPNILSFDHYPIWDYNRDKAIWDFEKNRLKYSIATAIASTQYFYPNLYDFAYKSIENSIPFYYILTPFKTVSLAKSINEFRLEIYSALIHGAKGIVYWSGFDWVVKDDARKYYHLNIDTVKEPLRNIHQKLNNNSDLLLSLNFASVYHNTFKNTICENDTNVIVTDSIHNFCRWDHFRNDKYAQQVFSDVNRPLWDINTGKIPDEIAISFMTNGNGEIYFWLLNKSLSKTLNLRVNNNSQSLLDILNDDIINSSNYYAYLTLLPGEAKLLTLNYSTLPVNYSLENKSYFNNFYPFESATGNINIVNTTFEFGSTKSFMAKQIRLSNSTKISSGSIVRLKAYADCNIITNLSPASGAPRFKKNNEDFQEQKTDLTIYPNPVNQGQTIFIKYNKIYTSNTKYKLCDISGKILYNHTSNKNDEIIQIPTTNLEKGIYFFNADKRTFKLIVK